MSKLQVRDLISVGIYTAIYIVLVAIAALICVFLLPGYSYVLIPAVAALISGTIFMLLLARVPKFGAITIMGSMMGILYLISGKFPSAIIPALIFALLADLVNVPSHYQNKRVILLSYVLFCFANVGPIIPIYLNPAGYAQSMADSGRDAAYIQTLFDTLPINSPYILALLIIIAAVLGGLFGQKMMAKHFKQAGIV